MASISVFGFGLPNWLQSLLAGSISQPLGFVNIGNSCWFNALTQAVFRPQGAFRKALEAQSKNDSSQAITARQFLAILEASDQNEPIGLLLEAFLIEFKKEKFPTSSLYRQEDAMEGIRQLIHYLGLDPFLPTVGQKSHLNLAQINHLTISPEDKSWHLALPNLDQHSVQDNLDAYFMETELILQAEGIEHLGKTYPFLKTPYLSSHSKNFQELIIELPRILQLDWQTRIKNNAFIDVNDEITLTFCDDQLNINKKVHMRLKSVVLHVSDISNAGHYIAVVRNEKDDSFICCDDETCTKLDYYNAKTAIGKYGYFAVYEVIPSHINNTDQDDYVMVEEEFFDCLEAQPDQTANHSLINQLAEEDYVMVEEEFFDCKEAFSEDSTKAKTIKSSLFRFR